MDLETSCWGTGALSNGGQTFYNIDNPVQRRSKIDYFDSATITPIVSHISSNGYYGYVCPTINVPTSCIEMRSSNGAGPLTATDIDFGMTDTNMPMESTNSEQIHHHQGRAMFENRKRAVHCIADEFAEQDAKRRRSHLSVIDYVEDMQMGYDDEKDVTIDSSNIAFGKLPIEQFIVCINDSMVAVDQVKNGHDSTNNIQQASNGHSSLKDSKSKHNHSHANHTAKKTDDNNDMENLYWHTHGSLLWQR